LSSTSHRRVIECGPSDSDCPGRRRTVRARAGPCEARNSHLRCMSGLRAHVQRLGGGAGATEAEESNTKGAVAAQDSESDSESGHGAAQGGALPPHFTTCEKVPRRQRPTSTPRCQPPGWAVCRPPEGERPAPTRAHCSGPAPSSPGGAAPTDPSESSSAGKADGSCSVSRTRSASSPTANRTCPPQFLGGPALPSLHPHLRRPTPHELPAVANRSPRGRDVGAAGARCRCGTAGGWSWRQQPLIDGSCRGVGKGAQSAETRSALHVVWG
jgi:hypothetical protein